MRVLFYIIVSLLLARCGNKEKLEYFPPEFADSLHLPVSILNDTFIMDIGKKVFVYKNYLVLSTVVDDYHFHIFDKHSGKYLKSFGAIGRGPGEIFYANPVVVNPFNGELTAVRVNQKTAIIFNIDSIMHQSELYYCEISLEHFPFFVTAFYYNERDNFYWVEGRGEFMEYRLMRLDSQKNICELYSEYPEDIREPFSPNLFTLFSVKCFSPDGTLFVEGSERGAIMEIFDLQDSIRRRTIKRFHKPEYIMVDGSTTSPLNTIRGFKDITATNKRIYTIYQGDRHYYWSKNIGVFDWNGNPLRLYYTDYDLDKICIDEEMNRIYAVAHNKNGETILVYLDLPDEES